MQVLISKEAEQAIQRKKPQESPAVLRLSATDEGCGCGATILYEFNWDHPRPEDVHIAFDGFTLVYDPDSEAYFDPRVKIDYDSTRDSFTVQSDGQIYLMHIRL
ncbi:iron-sulfur cluster biosynthesis family protein [Polycladomyces subterraneus]|uniref:Iron-sulfur cluster biosynthesis family protein n=1 Tax=Polycladomyces subterraneus TaxID=1016997 RepID=A0ABT8IQ43_9BACL|nr:iron-sulfur cluster biosynthesis family protein [Polycladomyces subterraneus]MDN4594921.1 iron-sulfur cluster biosynthesis family protein [Polycladomyces subterraneus]